MKPPTAKEAYAMRADCVYHLRAFGWTRSELSAVFRCSKEKIRQLDARGARKFQ